MSIIEPILKLTNFALFILPFGVLIFAILMMSNEIPEGDTPEINDSKQKSSNKTIKIYNADGEMLYQVEVEEQDEL